MAFDDTSDLGDAALLVLYANGDRAAARVLTARLTPRVLAQSYRMLGDLAEAEDVTQEALLRLWKIAPDWQQDRAQVGTWLYRVVANLCTDRLRKRPSGASALDAGEEPVDTAPSAPQAMQQASRRAAVQQALQDLPARQRQAVSLRHLDGLTNPEIAQRMDISVEAVESLTARGKRALAQALAGRQAELGFKDD